MEYTNEMKVHHLEIAIVTLSELDSESTANTVACLKEIRDSFVLKQTFKLPYRQYGYKIEHVDVEHLNEFGGANHPFVQVLKSSSGFYIGTLAEKSTGWHPSTRVSATFWNTREEADKVFLENSYPVKVG